VVGSTAEFRIPGVRKHRVRTRCKIPVFRFRVNDPGLCPAIISPAGMRRASHPTATPLSRPAIGGQRTGPVTMDAPPSWRRLPLWAWVALVLPVPFGLLLAATSRPGSVCRPSLTFSSSRNADPTHLRSSFCSPGAGVHGYRSGSVEMDLNQWHIVVNVVPRFPRGRPSALTAGAPCGLERRPRHPAPRPLPAPRRPPSGRRILHPAATRRPQQGAPLWAGGPDRFFAG
jgi:hypothetical protein